MSYDDGIVIAWNDTWLIKRLLMEFETSQGLCLFFLSLYSRTYRLRNSNRLPRILDAHRHKRNN